MELTVSESGKTTRLHVSGAIDERGAEKLKAAFNALNLDGKGEVVFDLAGVNHIGSAGLGKMLLFYQKLASRNLMMRVENTSSALRELLVELRLDSLFRVA